ncbi:unnamed protein product [Peniophora sp. CBMAI 1063]|nr:unnamed protein product [Peniophora sp. CBMAI 1063]
MAPRKPRTPTDYGNPENAPDFDYAKVQKRVQAFLLNRRNNRLGGYGLTEWKLQIRRLRSAITTVHAALVEQPDMSRRRFGWAWGLLRQQITELASGKHFPQGPIRDWVRQVTAAARADNEEAEKKRKKGKKDAPNALRRVREFITDNSWPVDQVVPPKELGKGLGPLQWWRPFGMGRQITADNVGHWNTNRRKYNQRQRKAGLPEDSDTPMEDVASDDCREDHKAKAAKKHAARKSAGVKRKDGDSDDDDDEGEDDKEDDDEEDEEEDNEEEDEEEGQEDEGESERDEGDEDKGQASGAQKRKSARRKEEDIEEGNEVAGKKVAKRKQPDVQVRDADRGRPSATQKKTAAKRKQEEGQEDQEDARKTSATQRKKDSKRKQQDVSEDEEDAGNRRSSAKRRRHRSDDEDGTDDASAKTRAAQKKGEKVQARRNAEEDGSGTDGAIVGTTGGKRASGKKPVNKQKPAEEAGGKTRSTSKGGRNNAVGNEEEQDEGTDGDAETEEADATVRKAALKRKSKGNGNHEDDDLPHAGPTKKRAQSKKATSSSRGDSAELDQPSQRQYRPLLHHGKPASQAARQRASSAQVASGSSRSANQTSDVPQQRRSTTHDVAEVVDARKKRSRRSAARDAEEMIHGDVNDSGPNAGDSANDEDYVQSSTDESDPDSAHARSSRPGAHKRRGSTRSLRAEPSSDEVASDEDQLDSDTARDPQAEVPSPSQTRRRRVSGKGTPVADKVTNDDIADAADEVEDFDDVAQTLNDQAALPGSTKSHVTSSPRSSMTPSPPGSIPRAEDARATKNKSTPSSRATQNAKKSKVSFVTQESSRESQGSARATPVAPPSTAQHQVGDSMEVDPEDAGIRDGTSKQS